MPSHNVYESLFGKEKPLDGTVIDFAEHGRVGGVSTGQGFKYIAIIDPTTGNSAITTNVYKSFEGGKVSVGTSAVEITFTGQTRLISVQADIDNTGNIFIGKSDVQSDGTNAMGKLSEGQSVEISLDDVDESLYIVSDTADQVAYKMALIE